MFFFEADFRVRFDEADVSGRLRPSGFVRYAQDLAWRHSDAAGFERLELSRIKLAIAIELRLEPHGSDVAHEIGSVRITLRRREVSTCSLLQMSPLRKDHDLVQGIYSEIGEKFQPRPQSHAAQEVDHLLEGEGAGVPQKAVGAPDLVFCFRRSLPQQNLPCLLLILDDLPDDSVEVVHQIILGLPERGLV